MSGEVGIRAPVSRPVRSEQDCSSAHAGLTGAPHIDHALVSGLDDYSIQCRHSLKGRCREIAPVRVAVEGESIYVPEFPTKLIRPKWNSVPGT